MPRGLNTEFAIGKIDHQLNAEQPAVGALHLLRQLHHQQHRRRPQLGRSAAPTSPTVSTPRRRSWSRRSRTTLLNELRVQYATRAQGRVPARAAGTGPAINVTNVANFGGPIAGRRRRRVRVHPGRLAGQQQPDLPPRRPRVQGRLRHPARGRHPHQHAVPALHLRHDGRLPGGAQRRQPASATPRSAVLRRARSRRSRRTSTASSCRTTGA